jgi:hypothetical protein
VGAKNCVRVLIHPIPSDVGSLLIEWISYDQRTKRVGNSVFDLFRREGRPNHLAPHNVYLSKLGRTVSPHVYCHHHQNPKAGNALTISPFLVDDDNHTNITGDLENVDGAPPECEHSFRVCFWNAKMLTLGSMLPLDFIDQQVTAKQHNRQ